MIKLFSFVVLLSCLSFSLFSEKLDYSILKLSPEKEIEFKKLPKSVQTLMVNEARYVEKVRALNVKKTAQNFSKNLKTDCDRDDRDDRDEHRPEPSHYNCVKRCTWRSSVTGNCNTYGSDFCGYDVSCSENCTWRGGDGDCNSYGADICG